MNVIVGLVFDLCGGSFVVGFVNILAPRSGLQQKDPLSYRGPNVSALSLPVQDRVVVFSFYSENIQEK